MKREIFPYNFFITKCTKNPNCYRSHLLVQLIRSEFFRKGYFSFKQRSGFCVLFSAPLEFRRPIYVTVERSDKIERLDEGTKERFRLYKNKKLLKVAMPARIFEHNCDSNVCKDRIKVLKNLRVLFHSDAYLPDMVITSESEIGQLFAADLWDDPKTVTFHE